MRNTFSAVAVSVSYALVPAPQSLQAHMQSDEGEERSGIMLQKRGHQELLKHQELMLVV